MIWKGSAVSEFAKNKKGLGEEKGEGNMMTVP